MPRGKRPFISRDLGLYHITSRVAGGELIFGDQEKEYFLQTLERYASGFYINIHAFAIMSNHLHILVSERTQEARIASAKELTDRYHMIFGLDAEPPIGRVEADGSITVDDDGGIERLRNRLGSVSRFVQEYKQTCSRWFNKRHQRKGYLWGDRFGGTAVERGDPELVCSAYIDLNAVRAGIVKIPEAYRWCSLGMRVRNPHRAKSLLAPLLLSEMYPTITLPWYRLFVYRCGQMPMPGKASISAEIAAEVEAVHGRLGIGERAAYRIRNISEGVAIGSQVFVSAIQQQLKRKNILPRPLTSTLFCTRRLASP